MAIFTFRDIGSGREGGGGGRIVLVRIHLITGKEIHLHKVQINILYEMLKYWYKNIGF